MIDRFHPSPFRTARSVDVWDTWFRWREDGRLRDISVDATWMRVSRAVAELETSNGSRWMARFFDAQSRWQLLFDERLLSHAGTRRHDLPPDPVAMVNAAAFVEVSTDGGARFAFDSCRNAAALAVRGLDNVLLRFDDRQRLAPDLRVGLLGIADALEALGHGYGSAAGRVAAADIARAVAEGSWEESLRLSRERGALADRETSAAVLQRLAAMDPALRSEAERHGVRHRRVTEITSQPRLALLANEVADALDPIESGGGDKAHVEHPARNGRNGRTSSTVPLSAQIALRGAVQPWIDAPIDYAFRVDQAPGADAIAFWGRVASAHRLGALSVEAAP